MAVILRLVYIAVANYGNTTESGRVVFIHDQSFMSFEEITLLRKYQVILLYLVTKTSLQVDANVRYYSSHLPDVSFVDSMIEYRVCNTF